MWGTFAFTLEGARFLLADAFEGDALGAEWSRMEPGAALAVFDALIRRSSDADGVLARILSEVDGRPTDDATTAVGARARRERVMRELGDPVGRIALFERQPPSLSGPAPRDLEPVVLAEPEPEQDEATFITFELFDQTGERLQGLPFELEIDGDVVQTGTLQLGHVHREDSDPGASGTLRLPEEESVTDQSLTIRLTGTDGKPVAAAAFELVLADGTRRTGTLDDAGSTTLSQLAAGKALLSFSDPPPAAFLLGARPVDGRRIEVAVGGTAEITLGPRELPVLELGDINFRLDRAVFAPPLSEAEIARTSGKDPQAEPVGPPAPEQRALAAEAVLARAFRFLAQNPHKLVCLAGHTDKSGSSSHNDKLSEDRALSVALYLKAGARAEWAEHAFKNAQADDYQQALTLAHLVRGYYCNPRGIDGDFGDKSKQALKSFKLAYNADFAGSLKVDDQRREEDWLAFYDIYDGVLAPCLGLTPEQLALERERVVLTEPAVLGCGERFPLGDAGDPDAPPAQYAPRDRRVDILFLDADDRADLRAQPPGDAIYGKGAFVLQGIPVTDFPPRPERPVIEVLEVSDANFDSGHCVLLPSTIPGVDAPGISAKHTFGKLFKTLSANNDQRLLCIAGHTDSQGSDADNDALSADRAENVLRYLTGDLDGWAEHAFARHKDSDYQRILRWISMQQGWSDADPGEIDGKLGSKSKAALKAFRRHFNQSFAGQAGFALDEDADPFEGDFHGFFFLYDLALAQELKTDDAGLAEARGNLRFAPIGALGCGEHWTIEAIGEDDHPSKRNRRVDILLLDPDNLPELHVLPLGLIVYGLGRFELKYINQKIRVPVLDLADTHFRTNRAVLAPAPRAPASANSTQSTAAPEPAFERRFADLFKVLERFPNKQLLVAGHTDSVGSEQSNDELSADRAESVLFYVAGKKDAWADHAQKHSAAEDYQQALTWVAQQKPQYGCDPNGIDNDFGGGSKRALVAFKRGYNAEFGKKLPEDDTRRKDDWGAFYDLYDDVISSLLGLEGRFAERQKALDERRAKITFTDPAAVGCGEHFTIERAGEDAVPSKRNRRVDVLLFDPGELPPIETDPPGEAIYAMGRFSMLDASWMASAQSLRLSVLQDLTQPALVGRAYRLTMRQQQFEDVIPEDGIIEQPIPPGATQAVLAVRVFDGVDTEYRWRLSIEPVPPAASSDGCRKRLSNLGLEPGAGATESDPRSELAMQHFLERRGLDPAQLSDAERTDELKKVFA